MATKRRRVSSESGSYKSGDHSSDRDSESDLLPPSPCSHDHPSTSFVPTRLSKPQVLPLLQCTLCIDASNLRSQRLLTGPVSLPCGHSICGSHVPSLLATLQSGSSEGRRAAMGLACPVAGCSASTSRPVPTAPTLHPSSSVAIYPPMRPRVDRAALMRVEDVQNLRPDIKIARVLDLLETQFDGDDALLPHSDSEETRPRRKRPRGHHAPQPPPGPTFTKSLKEILTCEVCFMLYYEPMTLLCGHTFCAKCLQRTLDQDPKCPLCRNPLGGEVCYTLNMLDVREREPPTNKVLLGIILLGFSKEYMARRQALLDEVANAHAGGFNTPVYYVSEAVFPGTRTRLTFSQPSQRLMLRRILANREPRFGVMLPPAADPAEGYGTVVSIRSVQFLPDNAAVAEAEGELSRFRLVETVKVDGYDVAKVELFGDSPELDLPQAARSPSQASPPSPITTANNPESEDEASIEDMMTFCRKFIQDLGTDAAPWIVKKYNDEYGNQPANDDPVAFGCTYLSRIKTNPNFSPSAHPSSVYDLSAIGSRTGMTNGGTQGAASSPEHSFLGISDC